MGKSGISHLYEPLIWLFDFAARKRVMKATRQSLEDSHKRRFRRLMHLVASRSRYYQQVIEEHAIDPQTCTLDEFPILTRRSLTEQFDDIVTDRSLSRRRLDEHFQQPDSAGKLVDGRFHAIHSSGTTGRQIYMAYTPREWIRGISHQSRIAGPLKFRKRCAFVGLTGKSFAGYSIAMCGSRGFNRLMFNNRSFDIGRPVEEINAGLNAFQPHTVTGYASVLTILADERRAGRLQITPRCLICSGDTLTPAQRASIESAFGQPVRDVYSLTELLLTAVGDSADGSKTLFEDDLIFELRDDHFLVTSLFHTTTPLIRYRVDDSMCLADPADSSPLRTITRFVGRSTDRLSFVDNEGCPRELESMTLLGLPTPEVTQYQLVYESETSFRLLIRLDTNLEQTATSRAVADVRKWLRQLLAEVRLDQSVSYQVQPVNEIPIDQRTGKARLIVRTDKLPQAA